MIDADKALEGFNKVAYQTLGMYFMKFGKYLFVPATIIFIILGVIYGGIG